MMAMIGCFVRDCSGATAIEYALVAALAAIIAIAGLVATGDSVLEMFTFVENQLSVAMGVGAH